MLAPVLLKGASNMLISVLKSKIAYTQISEKELFYVGSITIDSSIMEKAHLRENEQVQIVNLNNGERLETYVIPGLPDSGIIGLNGPAARKAEIGDEIFILSYAMIDTEHVWSPIIVDLKHDVS